LHQLGGAIALLPHNGRNRWGNGVVV